MSLQCLQTELRQIATEHQSCKDSLAETPLDIFDFVNLRLERWTSYFKIEDKCKNALLNAKRIQ